MRHALVTGGARGIGFGIVESLLLEGYAVTATGLTVEEVERVPARPSLRAVQLDVTRDRSVADACRASTGSTSW